jgi:hypothetical protein
LVAAAGKLVQLASGLNREIPATHALRVTMLLRNLQFQERVGMILLSNLGTSNQDGVLHRIASATDKRHARSGLDK